MTFPIVDRERVRLPTLDGHDDELWDTLIELSGVRAGEWTLIGGQMVFLHAIEHGASPPRISTDLDVLVNARIAGRPVAAFAAGLEDLGFELDGVGPDGIAHRYRRNRVTIDVLAPEGLGDRTDLTTTPPGRTLQVPGGTGVLALARRRSVRDGRPAREDRPPSNPVAPGIARRRAPRLERTRCGGARPSTCRPADSPPLIRAR